MTDTKEIRDAKENVMEAKENIQIASMEKEISGLDDTIDGLDKRIEESNEYYDKLIEQTGNYWDGLIKGLEEYKSRWQELADIEEQAKMEVMLRNLGITTDDVLDMSESAFESFRGTYLGLLNEIYSGNDEMVEMLIRFGGLSSDSVIPFAGTVESAAESLDRFTSQTNDTAAAVQSVSDAMDKVPGVDISSSIKQFDALGNSVDNTVASISGGRPSKANGFSGTAGKNTPRPQNSPSRGSDSLTGSIVNMGETAAETLGESGGGGTIGKFGELGDTIAEAGSRVEGVIDGLNSLDGMNAECTVTVNIETRGEVPDYASDTGISDTISSMKSDSSGHTTKHKGKAFAEGTGKYQGLPKAEKNALVSEYGQTEMTVLPNGDTIITDEPTLMDLPKDTVIYNEEQTKKIMDNKVDASGKAYTGGTDDGSWIGADGHIYRELQPGDHGWDLMKAGEALIAKFKASGEEFISNAYFEHQKQMEQLTKVVTNNTAINNITNNRNIQQPVTVNQNITLNCPNVTNNAGVEYLNRKLGNLSQMAMQEPLRKY